MLPSFACGTLSEELDSQELGLATLNSGEQVIESLVKNHYIQH